MTTKYHDCTCGKTISRSECDYMGTQEKLDGEKIKLFHCIYCGTTFTNEFEVEVFSIEIDMDDRCKDEELFKDEFNNHDGEKQ